MLSWMRSERWEGQRTFWSCHSAFSQLRQSFLWTVFEHQPGHAFSAQAAWATGSAVTSAYSGDHWLPGGYARVWEICTGQGSVQQPQSLWVSWGSCARLVKFGNILLVKWFFFHFHDIVDGHSSQENYEGAHMEYVLDKIYNNSNYFNIVKICYHSCIKHNKFKNSTLFLYFTTLIQVPWSYIWRLQFVFTVWKVVKIKKQHDQSKVFPNFWLIVSTRGFRPQTEGSVWGFPKWCGFRAMKTTYLLVSLRPMQACLSSSASFSLETSWA